MKLDKRSAIVKLTAFLPQFEADTNEYGGFDYAPYISDFMHVYYEVDFTDRDYALKGIPELESKLADDDYIKRATINQCRTLLTVIMRGDRFCDGYIGARIRDGRMQAVLRRMNELAATNIRGEG